MFDAVSVTCECHEVEARFKTKSESALYFLRSLAQFVRRDMTLVGDWGRKGVRQNISPMDVIRSGTQSQAPWKAGVAKTLITPGKFLWLAGFGTRTKLCEGILIDLYAKALALEDASGKRAVLVTADLIDFPAPVSKKIAEHVEKRYGLSRDRLILSASHTHSGPVPRPELRGAGVAVHRCGR